MHNDKLLELGVAASHAGACVGVAMTATAMHDLEDVVIPTNLIMVAMVQRVGAVVVLIVVDGHIRYLHCVHHLHGCSLPIEDTPGPSWAAAPTRDVFGRVRRL
mmetsp:Transcript_10045/g.19840  ORF Transcript_10045/g.19840 Transcript_10045/m.19840 type:complete len:103 (+) Transcript_10045:74-382(+)